MDDDHIPLKDEFSNDESDIDLGEKDSENNNADKEGEKTKKIKKKERNFTWQYRWVKIKNAASRSQPLLIKKWVKIRR